MTDLTLVYRSPDNRYRTAYYEKDGSVRFSIVEKTAKGSLISEFSRSGKIIDQVYHKNMNVEEVLYGLLGPRIVIQKVNEYERVKVSSRCRKCSNEKVVRELDLATPALLREVPVVPIFRCLGCGERFYAMSEEYLSSLVKKNEGLFEREELGSRERDQGLFVNELNEYIIRIFASKKISRLVIKE
jgi:hypothetical protein